MNRPTCTAPGLAPGMIASRVMVWLGVLLCVVALILLTPSRDGLFKRLISDGDERAASLIVMQGDEGNSDKITVALTAEVIRVCERDHWDQSSLAMLCSFLRRNHNFEAASRETLQRIEQIPASPRVEILGALVTRALADGDLQFAQDLQVRLVESAEILTPEIVRQAVQTCRFNSNPALALVTIDALEKQRGSLPEDLRETRVALARETSQPAIAFTLLDQQIRATSDPAALRKLIPNAIRTGIEAGRQNELIPLYEKYLQVVKGTGGTADPLVAEFSLKLARTYEWTRQPSKAFDVYIDLAARGNREALDRCIALNPGLFRQEDLMNALVAGYEYYRADDKLLLLTARFLGEAARREDAIRLYLEYLERNPDDAEAHYRLGAIFDEAVRFEDAFAHFKKASELEPSNDAYLGKLARISTTMRRFEEALRYRGTLAARTLDRDAIAQYYTLADGLYDLPEIRKALRLLIDHGGRKSASNYIYLAIACREDGDLPGARAVLEEALQKHPKNPFIGLELARIHLSLKRPDLALKALREVDLSRHSQGAQTALNALMTLDRVRGAKLVDDYLQRFGEALEESDSLTPAELLQFGEFCKEHRNFSRSDRLFNRVLEEGDAPGLLARAHFHLGQYKSARGEQLDHIAQNRDTGRLTSGDYQLLGDIFTKLGESRSARTAYQSALSLLQKRTTKPQRR